MPINCDTMRATVGRARSGWAKFASPVLGGTFLTYSLVVQGVSPVPTYYSDIRPLLKKHCFRCHQPGTSAPFALQTEAEALRWSAMIDYVVRTRRMPPWPVSYGYPIHGAPQITAYERELFAQWVQAGTPLGDYRLPQANSSTVDLTTIGWLEVPLPLEVQLAPEGDDEYWTFFIPWLEETELRTSGITLAPTSPSIAHHAVAYAVPSSRLPSDLKSQSATKEPWRPPAEARLLGSWTPGFENFVLPKGYSVSVRPGETIVVQVHYHKTGRKEEDRSILRFSPTTGPSSTDAVTLTLPEATVSIAAGESDVRRRTQMRITQPTRLITILPVLGNLATSVKVWLQFPDGTRRTLIAIQRWDPNWTMAFRLNPALTVPAGTKIIADASFDNSEDNVRNPNSPPVDVEVNSDSASEPFVIKCLTSPESQSRS